MSVAAAVPAGELWFGAEWVARRAHRRWCLQRRVNEATAMLLEERVSNNGGRRTRKIRIRGHGKKKKRDLRLGFASQENKDCENEGENWRERE